MMIRKGRAGASYRNIRIALAGALTLSACSGQQIGDPWAGRDPEWKHAHFVSQAPDQALRERAALTQIDR
jgi:hypothetical protein